MFFRVNMSRPLEFKYINKATFSHQDIGIENNTDNICLLIFVTGDVDIYLNRENTTISANQWLMLPPNTRYTFTDTVSETVSFYRIEFQSIFNVGFAATPFLDQHDNLSVTLPQIGTITDSEQIDTAIQQLQLASKQRGIIDLSCGYRLSNLVVLLGNQFINFISNNTDRQIPAKFEWIIDWMTTHIEEPLSVGIIASEFDITPAYLTHLFNVYEHTSTIKFIHRLKISKAKDLLLTTNLSIKQVAYYLSFSNIKYFMRLFKQETGYTPTSFRNKFSKTQTLA